MESPCGNHELILPLARKRCSLVKTLLSRSCVMDPGTLRDKIMPGQSWFNFSLLISLYFEAPWLLVGLARLALGQLLSVSAGGFRDSEGGQFAVNKKGGVLQTHGGLPSTPTVLQHSSVEEFPYGVCIKLLIEDK